MHALIIFDLDNFKRVNDTYGHLAGDAVLKSFSENLKEIFKKPNIIGRFGGDVFIVFVNNLDKKESLHSADNPYAVTKSIGMSLFSQDVADFDGLLKKAAIKSAIGII